MFVFFALAADGFLRTASLSTVLYASSTIGIMAVPVALLMIGGEFDLSAGVMVTSSALLASMISYQMTVNVWIGVLVSLLVTLAIGAFNGLMLTRTKLPSFIITLGTYLMLTGMNLGFTKLIDGTVSTKSISDMDGFSSARAVFASMLTVGGVDFRITILWWLVLVAVATWILLRTRVGNWIFAAGGAKDAARAVGVPVAWTKVGLYMGVGLGRLDRRPAPALLVRRRAVRRGRRQRTDLHHRRGHRRLPDHRRLRLRGGLRGRCPDLRHDQQGHRVRRVEPGLVQVLPRGDAAPRDPAERLGPQARGGDGMTGNDGLTSKDVSTGGDSARDAAPVSASAASKERVPLVELTGVSKYYGNIRALEDVSLEVHAGEITCVLGDNGAGKSTLIKIISGLHRHDAGSFRVEGEESALASPREALDRGIATVYQDLAVVPLMPVWRNFFLGSEPTKGKGPFRRLDVPFMRATTYAQLLRMGIDLRDVDQPIGTLSGGERQCVAIARAVYFGAKVLVLDEPTAALGVKQSGVVLKYVAAARDAGTRRGADHPQPAPRLPGRRPFRAAQARRDGGQPHP